MNPETVQKFNDWLAEHYEPDRTAKGRIRRSKGVRVYPREAILGVCKLLGGSYGQKALRRARAGDDVPARLKRAIRKVVELEDPERIRAHQRDQKLAKEIRHARKIKSVGGSAPDGGDLESWVRRRRERLEDTYETDAPLGGEAAEMWREICVPKANRIRRRRRAA